jgi:hypothetical protein
MENNDIGRVLAPMTVENLGDLFDVERGRMTTAEVRRLDVPDALVDTGSTTLALPARMVQQLGLTRSYERNAITSQSRHTISVYGPVRVTSWIAFAR